MPLRGDRVQETRCEQVRTRVTAECVRQMGEEHPLTRAASEWGLVNRDLEPQPV